MIDQVTPLEKIKIGAHLAVQTDQPIGTNPYPCGSEAHARWILFYLESAAPRTTGAHSALAAPYGVAA